MRARGRRAPPSSPTPPYRCHFEARRSPPRRPPRPRPSAPLRPTALRCAPPALRAACRSVGAPRPMSGNASGRVASCDFAGVVTAGSSAVMSARRSRGAARPPPLDRAMSVSSNVVFASSAAAPMPGVSSSAPDSSPGVTLVAPASTAMPRCGFRAKPITDSGASRSLIPIQADHRFRTNPISDSGPKPITFRR